MSIYMKFFVSVDIINSMSIDTINFIYILNNPHVYMYMHIDIIPEQPKGGGHLAGDLHQCCGILVEPLSL